MSKDLKNLCVLNTRPKDQAATLNQKIHAAGGRCIDFPVLEIQATPEDWISKLPALDTVSKAIFTSTNAVHYCFNALEKASIQWPDRIEVIAIGSATAESLNQRMGLTSYIPAIADSENLVNLPMLLAANHDTVLLFKGVGGRTVIAETLIARGLNLISLDVYQRCLPSIDQKKIESLWNNPDIDIILLTSEQSINNLFTLLGDFGRDWLCKTPCIVLSERLAKAATDAGIKQVILSSPDTLLISLYQFNQGLIHGQHRQRTNKDS